MDTKRNLPAFASEAEEAQWWFDHHEERDVEIAEAIRSGRTQTNMVRNRMAAATVPTTTITIQPEDFKLAAALAEKKGMDVDVYLNNLLHVYLEKETEELAEQHPQSRVA